MHRRSGVVWAIALALTLTACGAPTPAPTEDVPTTSPSPTPTAAAIVEPEPAIALVCEDAIPLATLQGALGAAWQPVDAVEDWAAWRSEIPDVTWVLQAGGAACAWNPGTAAGGGSYPGLQLWVLPFATGWGGMTETYGCAPAATECAGDYLVGDRWVTFVGATLPASVITAALAQIGAATVSTPAAWPPSGTQPLPTDCDAIVSAATVESATGSSVAVGTISPHGGYSMWGDVQQSSNSTTCIWNWVDADASVGTMERLSGGVWAWERAHAAFVPAGAPIELAGLADDDSAWLACGTIDVYLSGCRLDLVIGGNWLQIRVYDDDGTGLGAERLATPASESILVIGAAAVAGVYA